MAHEEDGREGRGRGVPQNMEQVGMDRGVPQNMEQVGMDRGVP